MVGTERRNKDGKLIEPSRKAVVSHWLADLHEEKKLYSATKPISDFILEKLTGLESYGTLFAQLREEGQVELRVGWFSVSYHSAEVLSAEALKKCGDLGIDIEINFYGPSDQIEEIKGGADIFNEP